MAGEERFPNVNEITMMLEMKRRKGTQIGVACTDADIWDVTKLCRCQVVYFAAHGRSTLPAKMYGIGGLAVALRSVGRSLHRSMSG